ncbi:MAG: hypothetical protein L6367_08780 [Cellulomonas sp.]|nr:hypothetical protein [Cellulomonas sp.]
MTLLAHAPTPDATLLRLGQSTRQTTGPHTIPRLHIGQLDVPPGAVEARPESQSQIAAAARHAHIVRLRHTAAVPSDGALARVIALVEEELAAAGRHRAEVRLALELQVAVVPDPATVARRRIELSHLDALSGLSWSPSATWVVTTAERLVDDVLTAAEHLHVDDVLLIPLGERAASAIR